MELFLLRHGEAGKRMPANSKDYGRTLTVAGKEEIEEIGKAMAKLGYEFDLIATSPLVRARDTASIVSKALEKKAEPEEWSELSPEGSREALYRRLSKLRPETSVLCVGHEPYLTTAISEMTSREGQSPAGFRIVLKKGGLAKLSLTAFSPRATGELRWLLTPRQIRKMA
jgi:phosphohistidine phosphatase